MHEEEASRRRQLLMSQAERDQENASAIKADDVGNKLRRLGVEDSNSQDLIAKVINTPEQFIDDQVETDTKLDICAYAALESLTKMCSSLHSVELVSGNSKLTISLQGVDVLEYMPPIKSLIAVRDACNSRSSALHVDK